MALRIEDSTGKFIEAAEDAAEVLKGLVSSLKGGVGKPKKIGGDDTTAKLNEIAKMTEKDQDKLRKAIDELPKKFAESFAKEFGDIGDWIEEIRDFAKDVAKKRAGGGGPRASGAGPKGGGLGKKDLSPIEKIMESVRTATEKTERIFGKKGSGYTHDIFCQTELMKSNVILAAILKQLGGLPDALVFTAAKRQGKKNGSGSGDSSEPSGLDAPDRRPNHLSAGVGSGIDANQVDSRPLGFDSSGAVKTNNVLDKQVRSLDRQAKELVKNLNRVHRNSQYWASDLQVIADTGAHIATEMDRIGEGIEEFSQGHAMLIKKHEKEAEVLGQVAEIWKDLTPYNKAFMKGMIKNLQALKKTGATAEQVSAEYEKMVDESGKLVRNHHLFQGSLKTIADGAERVRTEAAAITSGFMGAKFLKGMFDDIEESVIQVNQETGLMRSLLTDESWAGPGEYFNKMLDVSTELRQQLGQAPVLIRRAWITNLKKGSNNLEDMKGSLSDGLALATQIGANAEATAAEFHGWNLQLGLSNRQTSVLARNARQTSSTIGVWGDDMLKVVSATKALVKEMRNVGLNVDQATPGIMRMVAAAGKLDMTEQAAGIIKATSSLDGYTKSSIQMKNLIAQAGQTERVLDGVAMIDESQQKTTMLAIANVLKREFQNKGAVNAKGEVDKNLLLPVERNTLDYNLRGQYGDRQGIGESENFIKYAEDTFIPIEHKITKLNKEMTTNNNLTVGEKKIMEQEIKGHQENKKQEQNTVLLNAIDHMNVAGGANVSPAEAMKAMQQTLEKESKNADARGFAMSTDMSKSVQDSIGSVNDRLKKAGKTQLDEQSMMMRFDKAKAANEPAGMREIMGEISAADKLASTAIKEKGDPISKAKGAQQDMQARIQGFLGQIVQALGVLPMAIIWLAAIGSFLYGLVHVKKLLNILRNTADKQFNVSEKASKIQESVYSMFAHRGSGYTHDTYVVKELKKINKLLNQSMIDKKKQTFDDAVKKKIDPKLAEQNPAKALAMAKAKTRHERKMMLHDKKMAKSNVAANKTRGRLFNKEDVLIEKASKNSKGKGKGGGKGKGKGKGGGGLLDMIEMPSFEMPKNIGKLAGDLVKGAIGLAFLVTGIIALAVVIMKIAQGILKFSGLSMDKVMEIGTTTGAILLAAGIIGGAAVAAAYGLKKLAEARKQIRIKDIYMGALYLLILTPAMLLLGLAIVGMGAILASFVSIDEAAKIGAGVAAIMIAAGLISLAVIGSAWALMALGAALTGSGGWGLFVMAGLMVLGAIALLVLTPAMMLMAIAVLTLSEAVAEGVDVGWAEGVAKSVASIMVSAALIAGAVVLGAAAMTVLGLMSTMALILAPLMMLGALALRALTPAMITMAHTVIQLADGVSKGIDVTWASDVASKTASIMWSAAKIAGAVVLMAGITTVLGSMSILALILAPLMMLGALALMILTPAMIKMAQVIIWMASKMMEGTDPAAAESTAKSLADFFGSTKKVIFGILELSAISAIVGSMFLTAPIMAGLMILGAGTMVILTRALVVFGRAIMKTGTRLASEVDMAQMVNARKALESMASMARALGTTMDVLGKSILPMVTKPILGIFGTSLAKKLAKAIPQFTDNGGIIDQVISFFSAIKDKLAAAKIDTGPVTALEAMANVIGKLNPVIDFMTKTVVKFSDDGGWIGQLMSKQTMNQKINAAIPQFRGMLQNTIKFFSDGIVYALNSGDFDVKSYNSAGEKMQMMAKIIEKLTPILNFMTNTVVAFAKPTGWLSWLGYGKSINDKIAAATTPFKDMLSSTITFFNDGIVTVVKEFDKGEGAYKQASRSLTDMGNIIEKLAPILNFMTETVLKFAEPSGWWGVVKGGGLANQITAAIQPFSTMIRSIGIFFNIAVVKTLNGLDLGEAEFVKAGESLSRMASIIQSLAPILDFMTDTVVKLTSGDWMGTGMSAAQFLESKGIPSMRQLVLSSGIFIRDGIVKVINHRDFDEKQFDTAAVKLYKMAEVIQHLRPILDFMTGTVADLAKIDPNTGMTAAKTLIEAIPGVESLIHSTAIFLRDGIVRALNDIFMDEKAMDTVVVKLQKMGEVIVALRPVLDFIEGQINMLTGKDYGKNATDVWNAAMTMAWYFYGIAVALKTGLINPIQNMIPEPDELDVVVLKLDKMGVVVGKVTEFLGILSRQMMPFIGGWWWRSPLATLGERATDFGYFFTGIGSALKTGMIDPINNFFPDEAEVQQLIGRLNGMTKVMQSIDPALNSLSAVMNRWMGGWWWDSPLRGMRNKAQDFGYFFGGIGYALRSGVIEPIKKYFPDVGEIDQVTETLTALTESMTALSETLMALSDVTSKMSGMQLDPIKIQEIQGVLQALAANDGGASNMNGSLDQSVAEPITKVGSGIDQIGSGSTDLGTIFKTNIATLGESLTNAINNETVTAIRAIPTNTVAASGKKGEATAANPPTATGSAKNAGNADLEERVQQRVQNAKPPAAMAAANEELVKISANTEAMVQLAMDQKELLESILQAMDVGDPQNRPAGNEGESGGTSLNVKPRGTPNYYNWRQGRYGDTPTKQYSGT